MTNASSVPLFLFAKEPLAGKVKTRMQPNLSPPNCALLAETMLEQSIRKVVDYWPGKLILCVTPNVKAPVFESLAAMYGCGLFEQIAGDLGSRMLHALQYGLDLAGSAVVMGCDVPHIDQPTLAKAHTEMIKGNNIVGPAEDGGFYMLGVHDSRPELFADIHWGGEKVLVDVMRHAKRLDVGFVELPRMRDIDRWEDLIWLARHDQTYVRFVVQ